MEGNGLLSAILWLPLIGALSVLLVPERFPAAVKAVAMSFSIAAFGLSLGLLGAFQGGTYHFQMVESIPWIPELGITYKLGVDGISVWLIVLTTFLTVTSVWFSLYVEKRVKTYFAMILGLQTAMLGVFMALDLILFYTFFEAALIPMAVLIWTWGGKDRKYAGVKFFLYTFAASVFMLVGIIYLALLHKDATGTLTFDLIAIQASAADGSLWASSTLALQTLIFWAFAIALLVKCPMFPFHTWLPDAHTEAPTAGSMILAGVLLKMGTYGFLRFCLPLFPDVVQYQALPIVSLAVVGIIYGAAVAAVQKDIKRLIAYSSVAHMGFVMVGIFSLTHTGMVGGAYQQLNHGISTGALFLLVGLLYERIHTRMFKDLGGLKAQMPIFAALFLIVMLSSVGLPGTNGFVGEFLALMGLFQAGWAGAFGLTWWLAVLAGTGVVFAAVYLLWMFHQTFYGKVENPALKRLKDLKRHEIALVGVFVVLIFWGGLHPTTFTKPMEASLGAARMMALGEVGERPSWADPSLDVDESGNLVRVRRGEGMDFETVGIVRSADHYFPAPDDSGDTVAMMEAR